jgi:hypothetical protein
MLSHLPWIILAGSALLFFLAKWMTSDARNGYEEKLDAIFADGRPRDPIYAVLSKAKGQGIAAGIGLMSVILFLLAVICLIEMYWPKTN